MIGELGNPEIDPGDTALTGGPNVSNRYLVSLIGRAK